MMRQTIALVMCMSLPAASAAQVEVTNRSSVQVEKGSTVDYGITLALQDNLDEAMGVFASMLSSTPNDPRALNNLGNVHLLKNEMETAKVFYEQALDQEDDPGTRLNYSISLMLMGDVDGARHEATMAANKAGGQKEAAALLGLSFTEEGKASDSARASKSEIMDLLQNALAEVPDSTTADSVQARRTGKNGKDQKKKPGVWRSGGPRSSDAQGVAELHNLLYWKQS